MPITNNSDIPLSVAVWLLTDDYDHIDEQNYVSATQLLKPLRSTILAARNKTKRSVDLADLAPSRMGTAVHDAIESAWHKNYRKAMKLLGYPEDVIKDIVLNPPADVPLPANVIPIYMERRAIRSIDGYQVGGKFDLVIEGQLEDYKSTSVYTYIKDSHATDYILQGSIYRWLNPKLITSDTIRINFIFSDFQKVMLKTAGYPPARIASREYPLLSLEETEAWIRKRLQEHKAAVNLPEDKLPECTREELWVGDDVYKYYSNPANAPTPGNPVAGRATKNFSSLLEANMFMQEKGKGVVVTVAGAPKRCGYCDAFEVCTQKDRYELD